MTEMDHELVAFDEVILNLHLGPHSSLWSAKVLY